MPKGEEASRAEGRPRSCEQGCARPRPGDCVAGCGDSCAQSGGTASLASHELRIPAWRDSRARRLPQRPSRSSFLHSRPRGTTNVNAAVLLVEASDDGTRAARSGTTSTCAAVRRYRLLTSVTSSFFSSYFYIRNPHRPARPDLGRGCGNSLNESHLIITHISVLTSS